MKIQKYLTNVPLMSLVAGNCLPLIGVMFWGWDTFSVVFLYWCENFVVGVYNILRMVCVRPNEAASNMGKFFFIPFFTFHYGMFTFVHGVFVFAIFGERDGFGVSSLFSSFTPEQVLCVIGLFVSHGISFGYNFLYKGEYLKSTLGQLMSRPYSRVMVMHISIIFGGGLSKLLDSPVWFVFVLVILKMGIDVGLHIAEHKDSIHEEADDYGNEYQDAGDTASVWEVIDDD